MAIAGLLKEMDSVPMVRAQMPLIQAIQADEWWQDVTSPMLEVVRRRLRALMKLIEKQKRKPVYTDFKDVMGGETPVALPGFPATNGFEQFRAKARAFLKAHENHVAIAKLRANKPLTATDLGALERMLAASGIGAPADIEEAKARSNGLGLFVRSLVGLDRVAATEALGRFLSGRTLGASQIEFVKLVIDHLTEHGAMDAKLLYEAPFTDVSPTEPEALFPSTQVDALVEILDEVRRRAVA